MKQLVQVVNHRLSIGKVVGAAPDSVEVLARPDPAAFVEPVAALDGSVGDWFEGGLDNAPPTLADRDKTTRCGRRAASFPGSDESAGRTPAGSSLRLAEVVAYERVVSLLLRWRNFVNLGWWDVVAVLP